MIDIKKDILLAKHTTFKIGGPAKFFCLVKAKEDIIKAIKWAKKKKLAFFILGGGSNVLFSDKGYRGLIINFQFPISNFQKKGIVYTGAGLKLDDLVKLSARKSLTGLEWLAGIPGTVGGAVYENAQAFDKKISDTVKTVEVFDIKTLKIKNLSKKQCHFSAKDSIFKKNKNLIILSVVLKLKKGNKKEIQRKIKENLAWRKKRHPLNYASAGSVFVNRQGRAPSAYLIEQCGLKGKKIGGAGISEKHAGFIVNLGGAKAKDVLKLIELAKQKVKNKFGIVLKEEIRVIHY